MEMSGKVKEVGEVGYTPAVSHVVAYRNYSLAMMIVLRQSTYQRDVLPKLPVQMPTVTQLVMLDNYLASNKALYASISELRVTQPYQYFQRTPDRMFEAFAALVKHGYMCSSSRKAYNSNHMVAIWGLTGAGRKLLATYYAYLEGEYDDTI